MIAAIAVALSTPPAAHATKMQTADPATRCHAGKLKIAGRYERCRLNTQASALRKGTAVDFSRCDARFAASWSRVEARSGGVCPTMDDQALILARLQGDGSDLSSVLAGGVVPGCGDGIASGLEQCDGGDLGGASCSSLGYSLGGALACTAGCRFDRGSCLNQLAPATGDVVSYGPGSDGALQLGAPASYTDNGDGTITDNNLGLMWEKKDDSGGIHDKDRTFTWWATDVSPRPMDGTVVTEFLATLNDVAGGGANCFAGYCDWRIPNAAELSTIVDFMAFDPSADPAFDHPTNCTGCTDVAQPDCSCTRSGTYWTSTSVINFFVPRGAAMEINFQNSSTAFGSSSPPTLSAARAVRGGL